MRIRNVLAATGAAVLLAGLMSSPASAGTGSSTWCSDGENGYEEIVVADSPVTLAVEVGYGPLAEDWQTVFLCYSTTPPGTPGSGTGGAIWLEVREGNVLPLSYVGINCVPDYTTGVGPACGTSVEAGVTPEDVRPPDTPPSSICLVRVDHSCRVYAPGLLVWTDGSERPLVTLVVAGTTVPVNAPMRCVQVLSTAPC